MLAASPCRPASGPTTGPINAETRSQKQERNANESNRPRCARSADVSLRGKCRARMVLRDSSSWTIDPMPYVRKGLVLLASAPSPSLLATTLGRRRQRLTAGRRGQLAQFSLERAVLANSIAIGVSARRSIRGRPRSRCSDATLASACVASRSAQRDWSVLTGRPSRCRQPR